MPSPEERLGMTPSRYRLEGKGPSAPVVVERAGGGLSRPSPDSNARALMRRLTRDATRILRCDRAGIWTFDPDGSSPLCIVRYLSGSGRHEVGLVYPDSMGRHTLELLERIAFLSMEDVAKAPPPAPPLRRYLEDEGVRSILAVPIRREHGVRGFFAFESTTEPRQWDPGDRDHAVSLALQVEQLWISMPPAQQETPGAPGAGAELAAPGRDGGFGDPVSRSPITEAPGGSTLRTLPNRNLEVRLRRLRSMEAVGILGLDLAGDLRHLLEVQDGYLSLLEDLLRESGVEPGLLRDARRASDEARERVEHFLRWGHEGSSAHRALELNGLLGSLAVRLGKLTGDRVPLLIGPSPEPLVIRGHGWMLERAIEQLVRNAREASAEGDRVRVRLLRAEGAQPLPIARVVVEDRGQGIRGGDLPWIFEPWFTTRRSAGGEGLGLPLVQAVIEGHGGWVDVLSTPGEGTRFTVHLPLAEPLDSIEELPAPPGVRRGEDEGRPRALVVEDDPFLARLLERVLDRGGFDVQRAEGFSGAQRILHRVGRTLSLLVVERRLLAGERGMELVRRARALSPDLPAVLVDRRSRPGVGRGDFSDASREQAHAAIRSDEGIPDELPILTPPFEPGDLLAVARRLARTGRPDAGDDDGSAPSASGLDTDELGVDAEGADPVH
ncbi:MAG: GAF domain-containing protein [Gemmatimonadales bacterium]|nr:MAG: GAF domain-containing protein [Gemmatimonadales bacterium]